MFSKLHRRLLYDDIQGVSEPLDENQYGEGIVTRGKHILQFNELDKAAQAHRLSALQTVIQPVVTFAPTHMGTNEWVSKFNATVKSIFIVVETSCFKRFANILCFYVFSINC